MWLSIKAAAGDRGPTDDFWYEPLGWLSAAGVPVSPETAMRLGTVYACVKVLAESVAQLPLILYRRLDRGKERATDHPLYRLLSRRPNEMQTSFEWREMMQGHLALRGNAYSEIVTRGSRIVALVPLHPDHVEPEAIVGGSWRYRFKQPGGEKRVLLRDQVLHLRGLSSNGLFGLNPIEMQREAIGFGLAAREHGGRFYRNGAIFPGWIKHPSSFKTDEDRRKFIARWQEATTGGRKFQTPVLEHGLEYKEIPIKHTDAQYIETLRLSKEDIAQIFRVPPHKVGILDKATFSNIEQQAIEFVTDTMMPWLTRWEQRLTETLLTEEEQEEFFFEFLVEGLLRGDANARSQFYNKGIQDGWLTRNEVRERENLNPLDGLDDPLEPLNMRRAGEEPSDPDADDEGRQDRARQLQLAAADRVVRKEVQALRKAYRRQRAGAGNDEFLRFVVEFYGDHVDYVRAVALAPNDVANSYCSEQIRAVARAAREDGVEGLLELWERDRAAELVRMIDQEATE